MTATSVRVQPQRLMDQALERLNRTSAKLCGYCDEFRWLGEMVRKSSEDNLDEV